MGHASSQQAHAHVGLACEPPGGGRLGTASRAQTDCNSNAHEHEPVPEQGQSVGVVAEDVLSVTVGPHRHPLLGERFLSADVAVGLLWRSRPEGILLRGWGRSREKTAEVRRAGGTGGGFLVKGWEAVGEANGAGIVAAGAGHPHGPPT